MTGTADLSIAQLETINRSIAETSEPTFRIVIHPIDTSAMRVVQHILLAGGTRTSLEYRVDRDGTRRPV